jgi:hypothetical protein
MENERINHNIKLTNEERNICNASVNEILLHYIVYYPEFVLLFLSLLYYGVKYILIK